MSLKYFICHTGRLLEGICKKKCRLTKIKCCSATAHSTLFTHISPLTISDYLSSVKKLYQLMGFHFASPHPICPQVLTNLPISIFKYSENKLNLNVHLKMHLCRSRHCVYIPCRHSVKCYFKLSHRCSTGFISADWKGQITIHLSPNFADDNY